MKHQMDTATDFCVVCGAAARDVLEHNLSCLCGDNVIALSHLRAYQRQGELFAKIAEAAGLCHMSNTP